jgi:plastocyanin
MVDVIRNGTTLATGLTWRRLLTLAAGVEVGLLVIMVATRRDLLALALAGIIVTGWSLWQGRDRLAASRLPARHWLGSGLPGLVMLGLVFTDIAAYTVTGAYSNLVSREALIDLATPAALAVLSVTGLGATVAVGLTRADPLAGARQAPRVAGAGVLVLVALLLAGMAAGQRAPAPPAPSALALNTVNMAFSNIALSAQAGTITLRLANSDLFWHTFTVDALGVNVQAPVGGERQVVFTAAPGVYEFYCAIPGHALIGMKGTLTVR